MTNKEQENQELLIVLKQSAFFPLKEGMIVAPSCSFNLELQEGKACQ